MEKEADTAKLELARLQSKMAWRDITHDEQMRFIKLLSNAPKAKIVMQYLGNDPEAANFAHIIATVLHTAGYKDAPWGIREMTPRFPAGILTEVHMWVERSLNFTPADELRWACADALRRALNEIGVHVTMDAVEDQREEIIIYVGQKMR